MRPGAPPVLNDLAIPVGKGENRPGLTNATDSVPRLARRHLRFGWTSLLAFACLGLALETMHGFKLGWYLDLANETRRHLFTLAHAHGTLLALVNLGFAALADARPAMLGRRAALASGCLIGAGVVMPLGFLLGGLVIHAGDPGLGIALLPVGALLLLFALALVVRGVWSR